MPKPRRRRIKSEQSPETQPEPVPDLIMRPGAPGYEAHVEAKRRVDSELAKREAAQYRAHRRQMARSDVDEFCVQVGRDAETNERIKQEPLHEEFQFLADNYPRVIFMAHPESGKTTQLSVLRVLRAVGLNPNLHVVIVSKTGKTAKKSARAIREYIERNEDLHEIFPELVQGSPWGDTTFTVKRSTFSKDPTVQALGLGGTLIGSRVDVLIFDDILDDENTRTVAERKKVLRRVRAFMDRLSAKGVMMLLTNAWHPEDAAHELEKSGVPCFRFPVVDEDGESTWPAKWTPERIEQTKVDLGPLDFARAFLCRARDEGESPFDKDAVDRAFERGSRLELVHSVDTVSLPPGAWVYTGVDLAVTKREGSHLTSLSTILLWPQDGTLQRQLLWVESGKWSSREIRDRFVDHHRRYHPTFIVENNAAQRWIIDIVQNQADIPAEERVVLEIVPFTTGKNKAHAKFGIEGLAVEIAADLWTFTTRGPGKAAVEVEALKVDMLYYTRGAHTGDRLMATWLAREGARRGARAGGHEEEEERPIAPSSHVAEVVGGGDVGVLSLD